MLVSPADNLRFALGVILFRLLGSSFAESKEKHLT